MQEERQRTTAPFGPALRLLWLETRGERLRYGGALLALLPGAALLAIAPLIPQAVLDHVLAEDGAPPGPISGALIELLGGADRLRADLWIAMMAIFAVTLAAGAFTYLRGRWAARASEAIIRRLRDRLYDHLQRLPVSWHHTANTGDLIQRCTSDVETIRNFLASQVVEIGRALAMFLVPLPLMLALDPEARPTDPAQTFRQLLHEGGARDEASPLSAGGQVVSLPPDTPTKKARRGPASSQERSSRTTVEVPGGMVELLVGGGQLSQVRVMPFVIDKHLVTQRDYLAFVEATGAAAPSTWSGHKPRRDELAMPVTGVSFEDATAFALWHGRRLPTAAEWDLAARGEQGFTYPWGNTWLTGLSHPTHAQAFEQRRPGPIGVFSPQGDSPFGVSDLLQLWEWVVAPFQARGHMVRGGPWRDRHLPAQLTNQSWEDEAVHDVGFRLAG